MGSAIQKRHAPFFLQGFTLFEGLRGVSKADLPKEAMAGVTLAALMVPLNIGYAQVAGLPPIVGLYSAIFPMVIFALLSSSRQIVAGPDAPVAALIGSLLGAMASPDDPHYLQLALAQTLMCAVVFFAFWIFRLGFLANFLSRAVMTGFVTGLGIEVLSSQIKKILGVSVDAEGWFREQWQVIKAIPDAQWWSVAVGVGTIVTIRLCKKFIPKVPGALVALVIFTAIVSIFNLDKHGVSVLGDVPSGLPSPTYPHGVSLGEYLNLLLGAMALCGVTLADALLVGKSYAQKHGYPMDANQQLFAFGAANVASGFTGGFMIGSSASRTAAMDGSGSRSQWPSIIGAGVVALVVLFLTGLLALLPNAVLAGIVANAVLALIEIGEIRELFRVRWDEALVAVSCAFGVLALGSLKAVIFTFLLSTVLVVRKASEVSTAELGNVPGEPGLASTKNHADATTVPGLAIFRFSAPLYFANADTFQTRISTLIEQSNPPLTWFILDAEAITDIDTTGADVFGQTLDLAEKQGVTFGIARLETRVSNLLETYDLLDRIEPAHRFHTNWEAEQAFLAAGGTAPDRRPPAAPQGGS